MALSKSDKINKKDNKNDDGTENILYEILIYSEWAQEPETIGRLLRDKEDENQGTFWGWFPSLSVAKSMPNNLQKYYNAQMPWQLAVGGEGRVVAIVQEEVIEIRSSREDYASVIGKGSIPRDPCPQWRKTQWSPDCSLLAVASSKGIVYFFDLLGSNIFIITLSRNDTVQNGYDVSDAIAGMVFSSSRVKNTQWSSEFLVATFKGRLHSFLVSSDGFQENHTFSLTSQYFRGVTGIALHPSNNLLVVSGICNNNSQKKNETLAKGIHYGISTWRFLSDYPHYKLSTSFDDDSIDGKNAFLSRIPLPFRYNSESNYVLKMSLSPNGQILAAVHSSGALSFWNYPSMRLRRLWELVDQPGFDAFNPHVDEPGIKRKVPKIALDTFRSQIADINWWSDEKLIVARFSGAVVVASSVNLRNLLGQSPEWFEPAPQVSLAHDRGFLGLECEQVTSSKKISCTISKQDESSDEEENAPLIKQSIRSMKTALYYLTDSERFQPPKKKTKVVSKTYRLLSLKSTTPDELFLRKLDNEEYGEALALAKVYSLDCDLVYQRQWRKSPVSVASIQDYLSKITKRTWVLHECIERVPENIDAARELLLYGLRGCELETLVDIGLGKDKGRFVAATLQHASSFDEDENDEGKDEKKRKQLETLMQKIDFQNLTLEQKQLCQYRLKLLSYLDRLNTYEIILGGGQPAEDHYSHSFFKTFRTQSCLESSINFAQRGDWRAVSHMFTYHGSDTLTHRLPIISNIPETLSPYDYRELLPEAGFRPDEPEVYPWDEISDREPDWVETYFESLQPSEELDDFETDFYETNEKFLKYKMGTLSSELLTEWYSERALEIERMSDLVDNALELIKCGRERNIQGLEKIHDDLVLLETLVYECHLEKPISYQNLQEMKEIDKLRLLMSTSKKENFIKNVRQWLIPFLNRAEKHNPGFRATLLRDYVMGLAKSDILLCKLLLEASRPDCQDPVISNTELLITVALDCVYSCEKDDELESCCSILECLPDRNIGHDSEELEKLHNRVDELEKHLTVANILLKHGLPTSPAFIKNCQDNPKEIKKLFIALSNTACAKKPPLEERQWKELLRSILEMRNKVFDSISIDDCYEIVINSLLCSGNKKSIEFCSELMERSIKSTYVSSNKKLPLSKAIDLVISAGQKYFNLSASLDDPSIALAKCCFSLIEDPNPNIEEELDLILALSLLKDFKVNMIPLQVRLCKDRMQLILKAISATPNAYKNSQKLLRLATLVRVNERDKREREAKVLRLVAEAAYQAEDFTKCFEACQQLIDLRYEDSWSICYQLGCCVEFKDIAARGQLLSFALIYCSDDLIGTLIPAKRELELQEINSQMKMSVEKTRVMISHRNDEVDEESDYAVLSSLKQTKDKTMKVLQTTTETTKAVLATVGNHNFWRDAVKWVGSISDETEDNNKIESNKEFNKIGIDSFRCNDDDNHISKFHTNYDRYSMPEVPNHLKISQDIFRAAMIDESPEKSVSQQLTSDFVLDIVKHIVPEDTALGFGYLLSLRQAKDAAILFDSLPQTIVVLELASFYFCLAFFSQTLAKSKEFNLEKILKEKPDSLIRKCTKMISQLDSTDLTEEALLCRKLFLKYKKLHSDIVQAEFLSKLNNEMDYDVDVEKFLKDDEYKHQIILKLASFSDEYYTTAKCLAFRYEVNMTHFYVKRLCFLFEKTNSVGTIEGKIEEFKGALFSDPCFSQYMESDVLPLINGLDHGKLIFYYSLLMECGDLEDSYGNKPSLHIKHLQKLKHINNSSALNYSKLMCPYKSTSTLEEILNKDNIHAFSKIADKIPVNHNSGLKFHSSSSVFRIYCQSQFFGFEIDKPNNSAREWIQKYQSSSTLFPKMIPEDFLEYINTITFNLFAVTKLPLESRVEINRRALKYSLERESNNVNWKNVIDELNRNLNHLKKLDDEIVLTLRDSTDKAIQVYAIQFDMTRSVPEKIEEMLIQAVMECVPLSTVQDLLALAPMELGLDPEEIYTKSIKTVVNFIWHPDQTPPQFLTDKDNVKILKNILESVVFDNDILTEDSILDILRPFLSDESAPTDSRIAISLYLEQTFMLSQEDLQSVLLYKSQALLSDHFPDLEVNENDVESANSLAELYKTLLPQAKTCNQLFSLAKWLLWWPSIPKTKSLEPNDNIWIPLLNALINYAGQDRRMDEVLKLLELIFESTKFNLQCVNVLYERISVVGNICHALKLVILAQEPKLYGIVKELVGYKDKLVEGDDFDSQLLNWIVNRRLTSIFVSTPLYTHISNYLLNNGSKEACTKVIAELEAAGFKEEAKVLRQMSKNPSSLTTAISALRHWLPKNE